MAIVDELVTILGFKADTKEADKMEKSLTEVKDTMISVTKALAALTVGTAFFIQKSLGAIDSSNRFAKSIGMTYEKLQELEFAAVSVGGNVDELRGDLESLATTMSSPIPGEFNDTLALMRIETRKASGELKTSGEILTDLSKKFEGMGSVEAFQWGKKLGLSTTTIELLKQGEEGLKKLKDEAHAMGAIVPSENLEQAREAEKSIEQLKFATVAFMKSIAAGLAPEIAAMMKSTKEWVAQNKDVIKLNLKSIIMGVASGFKTFASVLRILLTPFNFLIKYFKDSGVELNKTKIISMAVAGVLTATLAFAIGAVITKAVAFIKFFSFLLPLLTKAKAAISLLAGGFRTFAAILAANPIGLIITAVAALIGLFAVLYNKTGSVSEALRVMGTMILKTLLLPINAVMKAFSGLLNLMSKLPKVGDKFKEAANAIKGFQDSMNLNVTGDTSIDPTKEIRNLVFSDSKAMKESAGISNSTRMGNTTNSSAVSNSVENNITISGAQNPALVAQEVGQATLASITQVQQPGIRSQAFTP